MEIYTIGQKFQFTSHMPPGEHEQYVYEVEITKMGNKWLMLSNGLRMQPFSLQVFSGKRLAGQCTPIATK